MRFLNTNTKSTGVFKMWPYTDEEADFLNGNGK